MKRILFMSDGFSLKTGYAGVMRTISKYLHSTGKYDIAYFSWFFNKGLRKEFGAPPFIEFSSFIDHTGCCRRGKLIEKHYPDGQVEYYRVENKLAMLKIQGGPVCENCNVINQDRYGYESLAPIIQHYKPDIIFTLGDLWMHYHVQFMPHRKSFKWLCYNPIDSAPTPRMTIQGDQVIDWMETLKNPDNLVMFCKFGIDTLNKTSEKYGYGKLAKNYILHGTDLSIFKPLSSELREQIRRKVFNFGNEVFLIGFFSRNQPRKAVHKVFEAIRRFKDKGYETGKKIKVLLHSPVRDLGWNLENLTTWYDLQDTMILNKDLKIGGGVSEETLNKLYNICDITTLPSRGEGFGLCSNPLSLLHLQGVVKRLGDVEVGSKILDRNGNYNKILDKTERTVDHYYRVKPAYTLPTEVTEEHPYLISKTGSNLDLKWVNVKKLELGDWLYMPKPKYDNILPEYIDIREYIKSDYILDGEYIYKKMGFSPITNLSYSDICKKYNVTKKIVEKAISYIKNNGLYDNHKKTKYISTINSKKVIDLVNKLNNDSEFKLPVPIRIKYKVPVNEKFLELCGWYLAEGSFNSNFSAMNIDLHSDELHISEKLGKYCVELFGYYYYTAKLNLKKGKKSRLLYSSSLVSEFFANFLGKGCQNKFIPWILENGGNKLGPLFYGLFHGDGYFNKKLKRISLTTTSISLAVKSRDILAANNILISFDERKKRNGNFIPYCNTICHKFINKFLNFIGDKEWNITNRNMNLYKEFDNCFLLKLMNKQLINKELKVMDICVENTHSFVANGILIHNTISDSICAGIPTLISDYSAHADWTRYFSGAGAMYINIQALDAEPITNQERAIVDVDHYADQLKIMYDNKDNILDSLTRKNLEFRKELSWTKINKQWEEYIDSININNNSPYQEIMYRPIQFDLKMIPENPINNKFELTEII